MVGLRGNERGGSLAVVLAREFATILGLATTVVFWTGGASWLKDLTNPVLSGLWFAWIFGAMLALSFAVVRHADSLAEILGEPYGTLILTLSVISIEVVVIAAVMLTGTENPALARDSMFAVLMLVLNGMLGLTLLLGGIKHHEQSYNVQGASAYLAVIVALVGIGLVLPRFTLTAPGGQVTNLMALFLIVSSVALYGTFLAIQTSRHRYFFEPTDEDAGARQHHAGGARSLRYHVLLLALSMVPIVLLSKKLAALVDYGITTLNAPPALAGVLVAALVLSPEFLAACSAALQNNLQRTVNISLGSALATIGLTIPCVLVISAMTGMHVELGLELPAITLLVLTLFVACINLSGQRTNVLVGAVHLVLLLTYVVLVFE